MQQLLYRCFAKINFTLEILGRRDDGYHDLASVVHTIGLADDLRFEAADQLLARAQGLDIEPTANLIWRAAMLLSSRTGVDLGAELTLVKRIPAAAGLGGGSSDAATTLVGLNRLWRTRLHSIELSELAAELGSDVPFLVRGGAALMRGRGDQLHPLPPLNAQWLVLVVPSHGVVDKTRQLYAALTPADFSAGAASVRAAQRIAHHMPLAETDLVNGFERAARALFHGLSETWAEIERLCSRRFFLSGAGPALFALAVNQADARRQQAILAEHAISSAAVRTVRHARASVRFAAHPSIGYP